MSTASRRRRPRHKEVKHQQERNDALRLYMVGLPYRDIAEELGLPLSTAYRRVQEAIDDMRPHADWEQYTARQLGELKAAREELMSGILDHTVTDFAGRVSAIKVLCQVHEREARLIGLDKMPTPAEDIMNMSNSELAEYMRRFGLLVDGSQVPLEDEGA